MEGSLKKMVLCFFAAATMILIAPAVAGTAAGQRTDSLAAPELAQEQRVEILIQDAGFVQTRPVRLQLGIPTIIILRNQDIVRHGFTSPALPMLDIVAEGGGIVSRGKGLEGFYIDPDKTLVIRFTPAKRGDYTFQCDLHPQMKGELFSLQPITS